MPKTDAELADLRRRVKRLEERADAAYETRMALMRHVQEGPRYLNREGDGCQETRPSASTSYTIAEWRNLATGLVDALFDALEETASGGPLGGQANAETAP